MQSLPHNQHVLGTLDDAADNDQPFTFGRRPHSGAPFPFSTREYVHLLILRSRTEAGVFATDDVRPA